MPIHPIQGIYEFSPNLTTYIRPEPTDLPQPRCAGEKANICAAGRRVPFPQIYREMTQDIKLDF